MKSLAHLTRNWSKVVSSGSLCESDVDCQHVVVDVPSFKCTIYQAIFCFHGAAESEWGRGIKSAQLPLTVSFISPMPFSIVEILSWAAEGSDCPENWSKMIFSLSETELNAKLIHYGLFTTPSFTASIDIFAFKRLARAVLVSQELDLFTASSLVTTIWRTKFHPKILKSVSPSKFDAFFSLRNSPWFPSLRSPTVHKIYW